MAKAKFTKAEIMRAVDAVQDSKLAVRKITIGPDGSISILTHPEGSESSEASIDGPKEWNEYA